MTSKLLKVIGVGVTASASSALAGDFSADPIGSVSGGGGGAGDWCESLQDIGKLYKSKENPFIQEIKVFGRAHYQYGYSHIENNGDEYSGGGDEIRRLRAGLSVKFLNGFKLAGRANFEEGGFRNHEGFSYSGMDELYLEYALEDVAGLKEVGLGYGRYKIAFGGEEATSSKKIKTVERSNLNNIFAPDRATGAKVFGEIGEVAFTLGVFSTADSGQDLADWNGGLAYFGSATLDLGKNKSLRGDFIYNDADAGEDDVFGYDWAASLTYEDEFGPIDFFANATYGDLGDDEVYGVVIMPSTYLIEDKLEAVFRYQWAHSSGQNIRPNSRNLRNVAGNELPARGIARGDDNHTFYAGLNYYLCDNNAKVMFGAEYETLDGDTVDLEATTLWAAFRMYF